MPSRRSMLVRRQLLALSLGFSSVMLGCSEGGEGESPGAASGGESVASGGESSATGGAATLTGGAGGSGDVSESTGGEAQGTGGMAGLVHCSDGVLSGDESAIDCGGSCEACENGLACADETDCLGGVCEEGLCAASAPGCTEAGVEKAPGAGWSDSYSVNGKCYCATTFDHSIGDYLVDTPAGQKTVKEVCDALGAGPGIAGNPVYNDIQCGNGPANDAGDEDYCPGRVDQGSSGCCTTGPLWDLSVFD